MGAVSAWFKVIVGLMVMGLYYGALQPVFDILYALNGTMGGQAATVSTWIGIILEYIFPALVCIGLLMYGVLESTRSEDASQWR
jgi:uncharacterized membrane protein YphA (DoxX/SURF4 family)